MPAPARAKPEASATSAPSEDGPEAGRRRHVRLADRKLRAMAARAARAVDWGGARGSDFSVAVDRAAEGRTRVSASGEVACSVAELRAVLRPRSSEQYASTMRELFGREFVYGAVVHRADEGEVAAEGEAAAALTDVRVKTATFARRHLLALSEQWCFVDALRARGDRGFVVAMASLHPDDVFLGKTKASVSALTGVTAAYSVRSVDTDGPTAPRVQVSFRAEFERASARPPRLQLPTRERMLPHWRGISERALVQRLKDMAASTQHLSQIIRRRRLSAQVFVDVAALQPPNSRCSCCTKLLATILGRNKKQCHLCGFFVCEQCSRREEVARGRVRNFLVRVCEHCLERVDDAIYDHLPAGGASSPVVLDDAPGGADASAGGVLVDLLQDALRHPSEVRKAAVKTIIRTMSELETPPSPETRRLDAASSEDEYVAALRRASSPPSSYELANALTRRYTLEPKPGATSRAVAPAAPIPPYEQQRLAVLASAKLSGLKNSPELELICDLGKKEIGCLAGVVSVLTADSMVILASSEPAFQNMVVPREDSICAHTILSRELPLLLPHPEADVRFTRQAVVRRHGLRFYFGFPLTAADGSPIGTFCCVDLVSQTVSKAQYAATERLARSASRLVQRHIGINRLGGPPLPGYPLGSARASGGVSGDRQHMAL